MFRYRLIYLLLMGFGVFFYFTFIGYFSYYFLLVVLLLPIISLIYLLLAWKFIKLEFKVNKGIVRQNEQVKIFVKRDGLGLGAIKFKIDNKKYFLIQASGDCMSPYINDKDYLVIEKYQTEQINDNDVYLFSYKDVIFIRRISKNIDGLILKSDNPNYKSENIDESDMHNLFIIGQVAGIFRYSL